MGQMTAWVSVLTDGAKPPEQVEEPDYFKDLNLAQVVSAVTDGSDPYNLAPLFHARLQDQAAVAYRQDAFRDLGDPKILQAAQAFCDSMEAVGKIVAHSKKVTFARPRQAWLLEAAIRYLSAVETFESSLTSTEPRSKSFATVRSWLHDYTSSARFVSLRTDASTVKKMLDSVRYSVRIKGGRVIVRRYEERPDYAAEVLGTFAKFARSDAHDYRVAFRREVDMNHVEAAIVEMLAKLFSDEFAALEGFSESHASFVDDTAARLDRELRFYLSYLSLARRVSGAGLVFCYPAVRAGSKEVHASDTYDLALAAQLVSNNKPVVTNSFHLGGVERIVVVSGPNQGGKTTFARTFGQLHHLASLGCPVPGSSAALALCDNIFTHFEREEDLSNLTGKLEDDLIRARELLLKATGSSVVIINEIFSSTTFEDARWLSRKVMEKLAQLDALAVVVSFIDELSEFAPSTFSMVSTVDPDDPAVRTFKVQRQKADGKAYASALARRHRLSYNDLVSRLAR